MLIKFPYQKSFFDSLKQRNIKESTLFQYENTLSDFFNYQQNFNDAFAKDQLLEDFTENDIQSYLAMLSQQRHYENTTVNKALSNIKVYFGFLFEHRVITTLPTYAIESKPLPASNKTTNWPELLPEWLTNSDLHPYTRIYLLLITRGFTTQEILTPDFYKIFNGLKFNETEQIAIDDLYNYNKPLQNKYQCQNLFLKSVPRGVGYTLTLAAFHRYLNTDSERLGFALKPSQLRNNFMLWYLAKHRNENPGQTMERLRLDIISMQYYQNQLRVRDLRHINQQKKA
ncbi:phage integrase N-terminal SAM-like domain-containing protein [Lactiplantibacillus plantarum]|uniref:phage integrase N-terminal SAM-like domain-containing protein n=1 Tax=Lactiplantibacillus plantarum TaxID=1590 RepID=UPI001BA50349|nr:phage integrase N-terminal SAM-like domain-containing protein [Lactiplantibacillus plantarum]MBS0955012.1 phage integrase N-terminal SAM-like domain-containing protein [Lactiplantibacillus plantarum]